MMYSQKLPESKENLGVLFDDQLYSSAPSSEQKDTNILLGKAI